jgi:uncharacterized membrane protein YdjX (TVP38/TMEM64 family)
MSAILGGVAPVLGFYTGIAALLGLVLSTLLGFRAEMAWTTLSLIGAATGCTHIFLLARFGGRTFHAAVRLRLAAAPRTELKSHRAPPATTLLLLGSILGAVVGLLLGGPGVIVSHFFWGCVALGIIVGTILVLGFAASALCGEKCREERDKRKNEVGEESGSDFNC